jgi:uncharacterized protein YceK
MRELTILLTAIFLLHGCATIVSGPTQKMTVYTEPKDSQIKIDSKDCNYPCSRKLWRWPTHEIVAEKEGLKPCKFETNKYMNPWILGNILIGGLIGITIDLASGSTATIAQEEVMMILHPDKECDTFIKPKGGHQWKWVSQAERKGEETEPGK